MHLRYRCLSLEIGKIYISQHVVFHEEIFPLFQTSHIFSQNEGKGILGSIPSDGHPS